MGEVVVETQQGDVTFEIKGDTPTPYEETRIMRKVRDLQSVSYTHLRAHET